MYVFLKYSGENDPLRLDLEKTSYGYLLQSPTETGSNTAECLGLYLIVCISPRKEILQPL